MAEAAPIVYILNGDDEFAIARFVDELERKLGDPATASMNTTRLEGSAFNPEALLSVAGTMPFLAPRRLVIVSNFLGRINSEPARKKFRENLALLPQTTALVLVENKLLTEDRDRARGAIQWLERWGVENAGRALVKTLRLPRGAEMVRFVQDAAKRAGGQITVEAAENLAALVDGDPRLADQEIQKLLAYVNYQRAIEIEDVADLTVDVAQGNIFEMVDALAERSERSGKKASELLHRLLESQDYYSIFGMVVRQFRLLILARDVLDHGGNSADVKRELARLRLNFPVNQLVTQAQRFQTPDLERIYRYLLEMDEAVKTSQLSGELALEIFAARITSAPARSGR